MANFNLAKAFIGGRLVDDPELKTTTSGKSVCKFTVAVNDGGFGTEKGQNNAQFFTIVAWGKSAEFVTKFFVKGSSICVEGRLKNKSWQGNDGTTKRSLEIEATEIMFVDSRGEVTKGASKVDSDINDLVEAAESDELPF